MIVRVDLAALLQLSPLLAVLGRLRASLGLRFCLFFRCFYSFACASCARRARYRVQKFGLLALVGLFVGALAVLIAVPP